MVLSTFKKEVLSEYFHILDFWEKYAPDGTSGRFVGALNENNTPDKTASISTVLISRILWTFSNAYRNFGQKKHEKIAKSAFDFLSSYFIDPTHGGAIWSVDSLLRPDQDLKQMYANAFCIYGLSEYYLATKNEKALNLAISIFNLIEKHSYDPTFEGYIEARNKEWGKTNDYILCSGEKEKSMNTHLHILEAYTNLYRAWKNPHLKTQLGNLIHVFLNKIVPKDTMGLFFAKDWRPLSQEISFGHDIEASWLLTEAAEVLGQKELLQNVKIKSVQMAKAATNGLNADGSMNYEKNEMHLNSNRDWWVQAEAMVGFYNAYQLSGKNHFLEKSKATWEFIKTYQIDHEGGEWFGSLNEKNVARSKVKINAWKCPYHNSRACIEIYHRLSH